MSKLQQTYRWLHERTGGTFERPAEFASDRAWARHLAAQPDARAMGITDGTLRTYVAYWRRGERLPVGRGRRTDLGDVPTSEEVLGVRPSAEGQPDPKQVIVETVTREVDPAEYVVLERENRKLKGSLSDHKERLRRLEEAYDTLEKRFDTYAQIAEHDPDVIEVEVRKGGKSPGVFVLLWSDWHLEEQVLADEIGGINEYDLDIAKARIVSLVQNSLRVYQIANRDTDLRTVYLWLGGDFVTGWIHEELRDTTHLSPIEAIQFAKSMLITALDFMLEHLPADTNLVVACNRGNHGRVDAKKRVTGDWKMSYEWMLYEDLQRFYAGKDRISIHNPKSYYSYTDLDGYVIRGMHGCNVKYAGGVGGITVPLYKMILRLDQNRHADHTVMGHYHQAGMPMANVTMNGSVIGYNAYAARFGFRVEPPQQVARVLDLKRRAMTAYFPVQCTGPILRK